MMELTDQVKVFLDTSALLKRYVIEQGSHYATQFFTPYARRSEPLRLAGLIR